MRADQSWLTALRSSAAAVLPTGESQTLRNVRTSRSPMPSTPPAAICGMSFAGSIGSCMVATNSWSLAPK